MCKKIWQRNVRAGLYSCKIDLHTFLNGLNFPIVRGTFRTKTLVFHLKRGRRFHHILRKASQTKGRIFHCRGKICSINEILKLRR